MNTVAPDEALQLYKTKFGEAPVWHARAPGRLELIGNHTDYNQGLVMSLAVDKHIDIVSGPRRDGVIELASSAFPATEKFFVNEIVANPAASWANYLKGVLLQLQQRGVAFSGFNAAIHGNLPIGAGMSSSAALEVSTALTVRQLYPYALTATGLGVPPVRDGKGQLPPINPDERLALAKLCQAAENKFVGVQCGLLDQISSLYGKAFHAIMIDCQTLTIERVPMIGEVAVVVCNSGVKHALVGGEYNELRQQCEGAARALGVAALRAVDMPTLKANKDKLTQRQYECAFHIVGENYRVLHGDKALRAGDFSQFGHFMFQSHESSRDSFKNSAPELDLLVEIARGHPAIYGARLMGGGFGGATINLVKRPSVDLFIEYMAAEYARRSGVQIQPMLCQVVDGAE